MNTINANKYLSAKQEVKLKSGTHEETVVKFPDIGMGTLAIGGAASSTFGMLGAHAGFNSGI